MVYPTKNTPVSVTKRANPSGAGGGLTEALANGLYLRLDTTNDPLQADLDMGTFAITNVGTVDGVDVSSFENAYNTHLTADSHLQYLLLAGRAGGQLAYGGTAISEELILRGTTNANLGLIRARSPIEFDDVSPAEALSPYSIRDMSTQVQSLAYVGGTFADTKTISFTNAVFIYETLRGSPTITTNTTPGFAAFTLFNALPVLRGGALSTHTPLSSLVLNCGPVLENSTPLVTFTTVSSYGMNFSPQTRATISTAGMNVTNQRAVSCNPTYSTVAGSTVNLGNIVGLYCAQPSVALFQPAAGTETMLSYYGIQFVNMTFGGAGVTRAVIYSQLNSNTNNYCIRSVGTAKSEHAGNFHMKGDYPNALFTMGASMDVAMGYVGATNEWYWQFANPAVSQVRWSSPVANNIIFKSLNFGTDSEFRFGFDRFAFGQTGSVGNQVGVFVAPTRTTGINGGWSDFLLTQAGNITIDHAMSDVVGWTINGPSITVGTGSFVRAMTLAVGNAPSTLGSGGQNYSIYSFGGLSSVDKFQVRDDMHFINDGSGLPFGEIYVKDNAVTMSVSNAGFTQVVIFGVNGQSNQMTPDHTNDHITVDLDGKYMVNVSLVVVNSAGAGHVLDIEVQKNNGATIFNNLHAHRTLASGSDKGSVSISGIIDLTATDTLEVWISSDSASAKNIIVEDITLTAIQVGG